MQEHTPYLCDAYHLSLGPKPPQQAPPHPPTEHHTMMDPRTWFRDLTPYFIYVLFVATLGPLLFGFHLVHALCAQLRAANVADHGRLN
jgi:hypothetical protein